MIDSKNSWGRRIELWLHIQILSFLCENKVRKLQILDGVSIVRSKEVKDELILAGNNIELVSRSATLIYQKSHVKDKDIKKFLNWMSVNEKGTMAEEE
ncbi:hypothetical protein LguiA_008460 [Lonicera macranthoides]